MRWFLYFALILSTFLVCTVGQAAEMRTWTSGKHKLEAQFIRVEKTVDGEKVVLKTDAGKTVRIKKTKLSAEDQTYIDDLLKAEADADADAGDGADEGDEADAKEGDDKEGDEADASEEDTKGKRPKGRKPKRKKVLDPSRVLESGDTGLVLPPDSSQWLNTGGRALTNEMIGKRAIVLVFFDEEDRDIIPKVWDDWMRAGAQVKNKPVVLIAVNSGNSRDVVAQSLRKHKVTWPTIVDKDRSFENHANLAPLTKTKPFSWRTVNGQGKFGYGARYVMDLPETISTALIGAEWRVSPKGIPKSLIRAWRLIENAQYHLAAPDVAKALKKKKKASIYRAAQKLDKEIAYHIEGVVGQALKEEEDGNEFAALRIYLRLLEEFEDYPMDELIQSTADEMSADPALKVELAAMKDLKAAKKLAAKPSRRRTALAKLQKVIDGYPDTTAAAEAEEIMDRLNN